MKWIPGGTKFYIVSDCGRFAVSKALTGDKVIYTGWDLQPDETQTRMLLSSRDPLKCKAACEVRQAKKV